MNDEFDGWIERELHAAFAGLGGAISEPAYRKAPRRSLRLRSVVPVVLGGKLATGIAITCMAAASSVAASTVLTGSPDPFTLIHKSAAPASSPADPTGPGQGNHSSTGGAASTATSNGEHQGSSRADPAHTPSGTDHGTPPGGNGPPDGGLNPAGKPAGNAPATPPGQSGVPRGNGGGTGAGAGAGHGHSPDPSSSGASPTATANPNKPR